MSCSRAPNSSLYFLLLILLLSTSVALFYFSTRLEIFPKMYIPRSTVSPPHTHSFVNKPSVAKVFLESDTNNTMFSGDFRRSHNTQTMSPDQAAFISTSAHGLITRENLGAKFTAIKSDRDQPTNPTEHVHQRTSLLIYGADRSGTTFTTKMFAEDPHLFTVYEPLWITSQWNKEDQIQVAHWKRNILDVLKGILSCKFADSQAGTKISFLYTKAVEWCFCEEPIYK